MNSVGIAELDENGLKNYLGDVGLKAVTKEFNNANKQRIHNVPLNEAQKYLLGESDKTLFDLNPKELSKAFTSIIFAGPIRTYSIEGFLEWLKDKN